MNRIARRRAARLGSGATEALEDRSLLSTITVTSLQDNLTSDGQVTLREAIQAANTDASVDGSTAGSGDDIIVFDPNLDGVITLATVEGPLNIASNIQIVGNGTSKTIIDGESGDVFVLPDANHAIGLENLKIRDADTGVTALNTSIVSLGHIEIVQSNLGIDVKGNGTEVTVHRSLIRDNQRGIRARNMNSLEVTESTFANNISTGNGAAIKLNSVETFVVDGSTFHNNEALEWGGALELIGSGGRTIRRSTFSGNKSPEGSVMYVWPSGFDGGTTVSVDDSTLVNNEGATSISLGVFMRVRVRNSIIQGIGASDIKKGPVGSAVSASNSLISNNNQSGLAASSNPDSDGNLIGTQSNRIDPQLGPLANNGGPTLTHRPTANSPVVDLGSSELTHDQRGSNFSRTAGSAPEMGAVEYWDSLVLIDAQPSAVPEGDEGNTPVVANITLLEGDATSIDYTTSDGTAIAGQDYITRSGTLNFSAAGETRTITVNVKGDTTAERDEFFGLDLQSSGVIAVASNSDAEIVIENDDSGVVFDGDTVLVVGDELDNQLSVSVVGANLVFDLDGTEEFFPLNDVSSVYVELQAGNDTVSAAAISLPFLVLGGDGSDTITTGSGSDTIRSGDGSDSVTAGSGNDSVFGGAGPDTILAGAGSDYIEGGARKDSIVGASGKDTLWGGAGNDTILGGAGDDSIEGERGRDRLDGGDGHDTIAGGGSNDYMVGGPGDDDIDHERNSPGDDKILGGLGDDRVHTFGDASVNGADTAIGGPGDDRLILGENDLVNGGSGDDTIEAGEAYGASGADRIRGWNVRGGSGRDILRNTSFPGASTSMFVAYGDGGSDTIQNSSGVDSTIYGGSGNDSLTGSSQSDAIFGGAGNDRIFGRQGNDVLTGGAGDDRLHGGFNDDVLLGGVGDDALHGDQNNDILIGGIGADSFYGDNHEDLVVAGSTTLSNADTQLVLAEWTADRPIAERVDNIRDGSGSSQGNNGTVFFSAGQTILNDTSTDVLEGSDGLDWFFANQSMDTISDFVDGEFLDTL